VRKTWLYALPDDLALCSRFADIIVPPPRERVQALPKVPRTKRELEMMVAVRSSVDMANFHVVVAIAQTRGEAAPKAEAGAEGADAGPDARSALQEEGSAAEIVPSNEEASEEHSNA
jgi:hypothetical protein